MNGNSSTGSLNQLDHCAKLGDSFIHWVASLRFSIPSNLLWLGAAVCKAWIVHIVQKLPPTILKQLLQRGFNMYMTQWRSQPYLSGGQSKRPLPLFPDLWQILRCRGHSAPPPWPPVAYDISMYCLYKGSQSLMCKLEIMLQITGLCMLTIKAQNMCLEHKPVKYMPLTHDKKNISDK